MCRFKLDVWYSFWRFLLLQQCAENSPCLLSCLQRNSEGTLWPQFPCSICLSQSTLIVHFACMTLFPWGSLLLVLIYFNFPFYLLLYLNFFFFFLLLLFRFQWSSWRMSILILGHVLFPYPYSVCVYVSHSCLFFWQCLPSRAALNFASSVTSIFPVQEYIILLPTQTILVDGGYFLS